MTDLAELVALMPFASHLGITLTEATPTRVVAVLPWRSELCTAGGVLHGGAIMGLADTAGAVCAHLGLPAGASTTTTGSTTQMLRAVPTGALRATATALHRGRSTAVIVTDLTDDRERLVARTTQNQAVLVATDR